MTNTLPQQWSSARREWSGIFLGLMTVQLLAYTYFFTSLIFTNHTFPNSWIFPYPSYKTEGEGRWFADLIIWVQGGSGVQPLQMFLATALQSVNGILFARFLGITRRFDVFLVAAFLCLYPAFLDYYTFTMDHLTFVLGDSLALLGITAWAQRTGGRTGGALAGAFFVLALACHQPKLALLVTLCLCHLTMRLALGGASGSDSLREIVATGFMLFVACLVYLGSTKLTVAFDVGQRAYVNSRSEMWRAALDAYPAVARYFAIGSDYLPRLARPLPALVIALGIVVLVQRARRQSIGAAVLVLLLIFLFPLALRSTYILSKYSWENAGRITFVNGYALLFFLAMAWRLAELRKTAVTVAAIFLYFFFVTGTQESNAATFRSLYELNTINRITARVEDVAPDLNQRRYALVVVGQYPEPPHDQYVRSYNRSNLTAARSPAFADYRQPEILNFYLGRNALMRPTDAQADKALASVGGRPSWPATGSVYVLDDIIVVLLEPYRPGLPRTWSGQRALVREKETP